MELGRSAAARNDAARAEAAYRDALGVVSKIQPGSAREAQLSEMMGDAAVRRKDLEAADQLYSRSLAVLEGSQRNTIDYARVSNALAVVAASRSQLPRAQGLYEAALKIYESQRPDSLDVSQILNNLGILHMNRGDMGSAEATFRRALAIKTSKKGLPEDIGTTHGNLGLVLLEQGRIEEAGAQFKSAVDLRRSQAPPLEMAALLTNLARIERLRGHADAASAAAREALELRRAELPQSLLVAATAAELGLAREAAKAYEDALSLHREALAIREKLAPNSSEVAESLERIAIVTSIAGDPLTARNAFEHAVDAWGKVSAGSLDHVNVIHELGSFLVSKGNPDEGLRRMREAIELLEKSRSPRPAGTLDARAQLVPRLQAYYGEPLRILAERGDAGESFSLLDRMHERLRLARCTTCDDMPPLGQPIDALKRGIEDGTLVVAYSVQPEATCAFVATRNTRMRVYRIDETSEALADRVEKFIDKVRTRATGVAYETPLVADGRALFDALMGQFQDEANKAERLRIIPDGPLDQLPFSALARNPVGRATFQYLVDWKPMIFAPSVMSAAAWAGGTALPVSVAQLFPSAGDAGNTVKMVGGPMANGTIVSLWTPADSATNELSELFKMSMTQGRAREAALLRAQRVMRDERGHTHPAYWAAFRYYGARGIK